MMPSFHASAFLPQLRDLLAHLDVEDGAATRRDRGVGIRVEDLKEEGASRTGTSRKSIVGMPYTVVSDLDMEVDEKDPLGSELLSPAIRKGRAIPTGMPVRVQLLKYVGPAKTFSIIKLSQDLDMFNLVYGATIRKSGTFCNYKNCLINHQGSVAKIKPGSLVVIKSAGKTAFLNPVIKADLFYQTLLGDWLSSQQETLEDWIAKFDQALASTAFTSKVNAATLEVTWDEERCATDFKTPRAKKRRSVDKDTTEQRIGISPSMPELC
jgi:hypothetical protein